MPADAPGGIRDALGPNRWHRPGMIDGMERRAGRVGRPARVSRRSIAEAALEVGLSTLTLTSLAHRLGVDHSTLYRHVASRDDIVLLACDTAIARMDWPVVPDAPVAGTGTRDDRRDRPVRSSASPGTRRFGP